MPLEWPRRRDHQPPRYNTRANFGPLPAYAHACMCMRAHVCMPCIACPYMYAGACAVCLCPCAICACSHAVHCMPVRMRVCAPCACMYARAHIHATHCMRAPCACACVCTVCVHRPRVFTPRMCVPACAMYARAYLRVPCVYGCACSHAMHCMRAPIAKTIVKYRVSRMT
jgi:hypothetical protein